MGIFSFLTKNKVTAVSVNDIERLIGKINLIDIRENYEYKSGHLPTAKNIPMDKLLESPERYLDASKEYHIICQSGGRSSGTCRKLKSKGFNIINIAGGTGSYRGKLKK